MSIVISAHRLSKCYQLGSGTAPYDTLREALVRAARTALRASRPRESTAEHSFWALQDVSFDVQDGQVLGIIGLNGAGKSTLLKILSRITRPTSGYADVHGRVGSLLEVGTGFHPELTGRENIYLNGSILGMDRSYINRRLDEIVAFAELDRFLDTPVKRYSSGMYMRLAFAVAAHIEPEILIIDEVLSVGDAAFQRKCLDRMDAVAGEGRTVLFVSHNLTAVQKLCNRAMWLDRGLLVADGEVHDVVSRYLGRVTAQYDTRLWPERETAPGSEAVRLHSATVRPAAGAAGDLLDVHTPLTLEFEYWNMQPGARLNLSVVVYNEEGTPLFNTFPSSTDEWRGAPFPPGLFRSECVIPGGLLNNGLHRVQLYVVRDQGVVLSRHDDLLVFEVLDMPDDRGAWFGKWIGAVRPRLNWQTELLLEDEAESAEARRG
jgi:lipopolysaccharide transport system ATP-binding protein